MDHLLSEKQNPSLPLTSHRRRNLAAIPQQEVNRDICTGKAKLVVGTTLPHVSGYFNNVPTTSGEWLSLVTKPQQKENGKSELVVGTTCALPSVYNNTPHTTFFWQRAISGNITPEREC